MRPFLLALVCLGALSLAPRPATAGGVVEGRHVRVQGDVPTAWLDTAARLGDALFGRLAEDLGRTPTKDELPLELTLTVGAEALDRLVGAARRKQEEERLGAHLGAWTRWDPCHSYVAIQPEPFDTRRLILHELVHQFRARLRPVSMRGREAAWYREGIAEWYGWHRHTEDGLVFGAFDAVTRNPMVHRLARLAQDRDYRAFDIATGEAPATYADAIALVGALRGTEDETLRRLFARFEEGVLERGGGTASFRRLFAEDRDAVDAAVWRYWQRMEPRLWSGSGRGFDERDGVVEGRSEHVVIARPDWLGGPWERLGVEIEPRGAEAGAAGFVFPGVRNHDPDLAVLVRRGRLVVAWLDDTWRAAARAVRRGLPDSWKPVEVASTELPAAPRYGLRLRFVGRTVEIEVTHGEGATSLRHELRADAERHADLRFPWLIVLRGAAAFRDLRVDGRAGPKPASEKK